MTKELTTFHGCSGKLGKILIEAHGNGLEVREITRGMNGYPEPFDGEFFVSGFEDFAAAEAFAKTHGGEVGAVNFKNGWNNVEKFCPVWGPLTIDDVPCDGEVWSKNVGEERERLAGEIADITTDEDDREHLRKQLAELVDLKPENELVGSEVYDHAGPHMCLSYDLKYVEIGVKFCEADFAENFDEE